MKILMAALGIILSLSLNCHAAQPQDCLDRIQATLDTGDAETFAQLVDLDRMTEAAIEALADAAAQPGEKLVLDPMVALLFAQLSGSKGSAIRDMLGDEIKNYILNGVRSGSFAGRVPTRSRSGGILASLFANASTGRKEVLAKGAPVADAEGWHMPFIIHDYGNGQNYRIIGRFLATESGARLVEIENLEEIVAQLQNEVAK